MPAQKGPQKREREKEEGKRKKKRSTRYTVARGDSFKRGCASGKSPLSNPEHDIEMVADFNPVALTSDLSRTDINRTEAMGSMRDGT